MLGPIKNDEVKIDSSKYQLVLSLNHQIDINDFLLRVLKWPNKCFFLRVSNTQLNNREFCVSESPKAIGKGSFVNLSKPSEPNLLPPQEHLSPLLVSPLIDDSIST